MSATFTQHLFMRSGEEYRIVGHTAAEWERADALDREWLSAPPNQTFTITVDGAERQIAAGDIAVTKLEGGPL